MTAPTPTPGAVLDAESADGWITHDGGPNPVPGQRVDLAFYGSGGAVANVLSDQWTSNWEQAVPGHPDDNHVRAYRLARPTPEGETTPSITAPMESEAAPDVSKRAKALSELAALDGETMDLPAQPKPGAGELEVVGWVRKRPHWDFWSPHYGPPVDMEGYICKQTVTLESAQAKIARLEGLLAVHKGISDGKTVIIQQLEARALLSDLKAGAGR